MTNAFNWKAFTDEERAKRNENPDAINTPLRRSKASAAAVERIRINNPTYGTHGLAGKAPSLLKDIK